MSRDGTKATHCRFCHEPGELVKGAHRECKNKVYLDQTRIKRGITPERWTAEVDRKISCNTCGVRPRNGKSYECIECKASRVKTVKRVSHAAYMKRRRAKVAKVERPCKCGCGRMVTGYRLKYASQGCWPKHKPPVKPAPPPVKPQAWSAKISKRMPEMFVGATVDKYSIVRPSVQEPPTKIINNGVTIHRIPSMMPTSLRETDMERDMRWDELRTYGWKG